MIVSKNCISKYTTNELLNKLNIPRQQFYDIVWHLNLKPIKQWRYGKSIKTLWSQEVYDIVKDFLDNNKKWNIGEEIW
jgi:hypothetical protein